MSEDMIPAIPSPAKPELEALASGSRRDTAEACRERAAADLLESVTMITANQRLRLESSAASWTVRADMLERIEDSFARRAAVVVAEPGLDGDEAAPERS
jgi:hypothetical protein